MPNAVVWGAGGGGGGGLVGGLGHNVMPKMAGKCVRNKMGKKAPIGINCQYMQMWLWGASWVMISGRAWDVVRI